MISSSSSNCGKGSGRPDGLDVFVVKSAARLLLADKHGLDEMGETVLSLMKLKLPGDGRLAEERLNENRRENRRSPDGGELTPRPAIGVSTAPAFD